MPNLNPDLNGDSQVDMADFSKLAAHWKQVLCGECDGADLTGDSNVNMSDVLVFAEYWMIGVVPE